MAKDVNGKRVKVGQTVRRAAWGSDIIPLERRTKTGVPVLATDARRRDLAGRICAQLILGCPVWERGEQFEIME